MAGMVLDRTAWVIGSIAVRLGRLGIRYRRRPAAPARIVELMSGDGLRIAATYWPGRRPASPAVLIVHGFMASRVTVQPNAEWFAAQGYAVLTIDLRGHGGSGGAVCGFGWPESQDVHAAFAWLKHKQAGAKIAVIGISMGGAAALAGPAGPVPAEAIVLQAVFVGIQQAIDSRVFFVGGRRFADWFAPKLTAQVLPRLGVAPEGLSPLAVVRQLTCPVLVVGGGRDGFTPPDETHALYEAAQEPKALLIMPGLGHGGVSDTQDPVYRQRVLAFLLDAIGAPSA
jgi:alpha-beta hydrolase superfamily lysophospholipase